MTERCASSLYRPEVASTGRIARRIALVLACVVILCGVTLIFLAGRPPRTFAASWTAPGTIASNAGTTNFGAVPEPTGRWDLLWIDTKNHVLFLPGRGNAAGPVSLDRGEVDEPTLARVGTDLFAAWIRNYNGGTDLRAAFVPPKGSTRVFTLLHGAAPIEHPYAFVGPDGRPSVVFSWQKRGPFEVFLISLAQGGSRPLVETRLTSARYYSFNPQAITDAQGNVEVLHLESCCSQQTFRVDWDRFNAEGRRLGTTKVLASVEERNVNTLQRGEAVGRDLSGNIWAAFTLDGGVGLMRASRDGLLQGQLEGLDPVAEQPRSIALALGPNGGYGIWEQDNGIGIDLAGRHFDTAGMGSAERIEYISGQQQNVHAGYFGGQYRVIWQSLAPDGSYVFETNEHRKAAGPDLAERLGLGLGNPWSAAALLFGGAAGLGVLGASANVIVALVLAGLGLVLLRLLRRVPGRWIAIAVYLAAALYVIFVKPGVPILFLTTLPEHGFSDPQYVVPAMAGAFVLLTLMAFTALRRMDDLYRVISMAFLGMFFFAFIEAALFVQQELGYI